MKPLHLRARNFRTFSDLDLTFGTGVVGILGELRDAPEGADSNGAGKSTILEAIDICLFGRRSLAGYLTRGGEADELMVELVFAHNDNVYRVRRTYSPKGRGVAKVDLERMGAATEEEGVHYAMRSPAVFETLTQATNKETDALLCDIIGLSQQTFRDSCYLRQGDGGYADPDRDPKQRKELLVEAVLGRDPIWPRLADIAKARRRAAEQQLEQAAGEERLLREQTAGANEAQQAVQDAAVVAIAAADALRDAEKRRDEVARLIAESRENAAARQAAAAELQAAQQALTAIETRVAEADAAAREIMDAQENLAALPTAEQLRELEERELELRRQKDAHLAAYVAYQNAKRDYDTARVRRSDLDTRAHAERARADELRAKAAAVLAGAADQTCDRCGQTLGAEAAAQAAASYRIDASAADVVAAKLETEAAAVTLPDVPDEPVAPEGIETLDDLRPHVANARTQQQERAKLEERIAQLRKVSLPPAEEITAAQAAVTGAREKLAAVPELVMETLDEDGAGRSVNDARIRHEEAVATKARADERLAAVRNAQHRLDEIARQNADVHTAIDRDALLEKAYGRDGIPALIIENTAIPSIEAEASRILRALGTSFDVQLRTQQETKTGNLRDTLEVVVIDQDGNEADYADGCSGGEQTRIGLALRIALARLLAHRRGAESRLLALDEPSYLDAAGMSALLDVLRGLDREFDLILLVSHVAELRDALDQTIVVVKEAGVSSVAGDRVLEAVADDDE